MAEDIVDRLRILSQWPMTPAGVTGKDASAWCLEASQTIADLRFELRKALDQRDLLSVQNSQLRNSLAE